MANPEERAMIKTFVDLDKHLQHCADEVSLLLYSEEMIPKDTHDKVTKDSRAVRDMMTCLTDRVASDSKEFTKIVEILLRVPTLKIVVEKLKENYGESRVC